MEEAEELPVLEEFRYFLDLPEEIRCEIYRLLVLNPPHKFMYAEPIKGKWWDAGWSHEIDSMPDLDGSDSEDETDRMVLKESNPEDNGSMSGLIKSDLGSLKLKGKPLLDVTECGYRNERHFEIFRVSRQMYSETSTIWYRELEVLIEPEFVLSLGKSSGSLKLGAAAEAQPWGHNSLNGIGREEGNGGIVTSKMPEMEGRMEPHVLARFRRIHFCATFSYLHTENIKFQVLDELDELDACTVHPHHAAEYKKILRASPIMTNFVRVLSNSPYIMSLRVSLSVQIMPTSDFMTDNEFDDVFLGKINQRATELFLDSGICDSLLALSNVQKFDFELDLGSERDPYIPLQHHVTQIQEMKSIIESNFTDQEVQPFS